MTQNIKDLADAYSALITLGDDANVNVRSAAHRAVIKLKADSVDIQGLIQQALNGSTEDERIEAINDICDFLASSKSGFV